MAALLRRAAPEASGQRGSRQVSYPGRPGAKPVAELIGKTLDPLMRKRGLARAELLSWWPEIVGTAYAGSTAPEKIRWPRDGGAGTLVVACDPAIALQFS